MYVFMCVGVRAGECGCGCGCSDHLRFRRTWVQCVCFCVCFVLVFVCVRVCARKHMDAVWIRLFDSSVIVLMCGVLVYMCMCMKERVSVCVCVRVCVRARSADHWRVRRSSNASWCLSRGEREREREGRVICVYKKKSFKPDLSFDR